MDLWERLRDAITSEGTEKMWEMKSEHRNEYNTDLQLTPTPPGIHEEILRGSDTTISWEDVFQGDEMRTVPGFHEEVERKVKMGF